MSEEQPVFKVTDRRLFNSDGTPREVVREEDSTKKTDASATASEAAATSATTAADASSASNAASATAASATGAPAASQSQTRASENPSVETSAASAGSAASAAPTAFDDLPEGDDAYAESDIPGADDPTSFINFLMSIASNAAASLGMMEHPVTGERAVDLQLGKHWIDVLGMLQQKTRGNLVPQEQQIFEGLLADLRMQFVSLTKAPQPKAPRGFTGRDIIGG